MPKIPSFAKQVAALPEQRKGPLWAGPCAEGPMGGVTQSMMAKFLACRERFRLRYVVGLEQPRRWDRRSGYGDMWHTCEEAHAAGVDVATKLLDFTTEQMKKYPMDREDIQKWFCVASVQFPEYVKYWSRHPDVKNRTPLMQEQVFDVPYILPSGRVVRLRGKYDSVDLIDGGVWLQENKTKGDIDGIQLERQLRFDLQTMMYLIALQEHNDDVAARSGCTDLTNLKGVRYNVVRRPLSGGKGTIVPHKGKCTKEVVSKKDGRVLHPSKITHAETPQAYYERLRRDYIAAEPEYWFFRLKVEVSARDIQTFKTQFLNPFLEQLCWWYDDEVQQRTDYPPPPLNYRHPYGCYNALNDGGATEYDAYLATGSEAGLHRRETLFDELQ